MLKKQSVLISIFFLMVFLACASTAERSPTTEPEKGAKAIFDSGHGSTVQMSAAKTQSAKATETKVKSGGRTAPAEAPYVGIKYQILILRQGDNFVPVTDAHVFKAGDRIKILVRSNYAVNLFVRNIGTTGQAHQFFRGPIKPFDLIEIPPRGLLRFDENPGTEIVQIMLSKTSDQLENIPEKILVSYSGAKDILLEDDLESKFGFLSPLSNWAPDPAGRDYIRMQSTDGENYGVAPLYFVENEKVLALEINLKHN